MKDVTPAASNVLGILYFGTLYGLTGHLQVCGCLIGASGKLPVACRFGGKGGMVVVRDSYTVLSVGYSAIHHAQHGKM